MKILQILPELNIGGVERGTVDLVGELTRCGHQALVVSHGGILVKELESCGGRHIKLAVHKKSLFSIIGNIPKLAKIIREEKIDLVHARSRVPAIIAFLACRRTGTNFMTTCHGYYSQNLASRVMGWGKVVIVASDAIARHMIKDFGVPQERISFIPRGVDLERFKFSPKFKNSRLGHNPLTIGLIGRLTPLKGHKYFLQALARVVRTFPKTRALIVGEASRGKKEYKEELLMLTRRLSLDNYVQFVGQKTDIPAILSQLDVLVLPTVTQEAFGRVLIEAAAAGVPTVATRVGGIIDIIRDGENGLLVEPADAADLASAIIRLIKDQGLAQKLVLAARKKVEASFSLSRMSQETIRVYEQVCSTLRILVIKLSALGDAILTGPSVRALRKDFPRAEITVLTTPALKSIFQSCPYVNRVLELPLEKNNFKYLWTASAELRKINFDAVVDLQNNRKSHLLAYLSGCNRRYGYAHGKFGFLLNRKTKAPKAALSPVQHQARLLSLLGIEAVEENLELWPKAEDESWADNFLKEHQQDKGAILIGINLGASVRWPSKRWLWENLAALIDKLGQEKFEIVVTGKGEDKRALEKLKGLCQTRFINAVNRTNIMQLACLIRRVAVYITSDSAALHIAYAMQTPVVALFGPTDPARHTIAGARQIILKKDEACSPCYKRRCREHRCMRGISAEEVFLAVKSFLV